MEIAAANKGAVYVVKRKDHGERFESHVCPLRRFESKGRSVGNHGSDDPLKEKKKNLLRLFIANE